MRLVREPERQAALELLLNAREGALADIAAFPLAVNTPWRLARREALDARLAEIDEATRLYRQPRVYLPLDTPNVAETSAAAHEATEAAALPYEGADDDADAAFPELANS